MQEKRFEVFVRFHGVFNVRAECCTVIKVGRPRQISSAHCEVIIASRTGIVDQL
jgi:hypothetical protein